MRRTMLHDGVWRQRKIRGGKGEVASSNIAVVARSHTQRHKQQYTHPHRHRDTDAHTQIEEKSGKLRIIGWKTLIKNFTLNLLSFL